MVTDTNDTKTDGYNPPITSRTRLQKIKLSQLANFNYYYYYSFNQYVRDFCKEMRNIDLT